MPDPIQEELRRQLIAVRGELRLLRFLLLFVGLLVGLLFFQSTLGVAVLAWASEFRGGVAAGAGIILAVLLAAVFASHYLPKRPETPESGIGDTTI